MGFVFRPAKREGAKLLIGLAGQSGSGKTYSALLLAKGIQAVDGGEIFVIDTENRRSEHYADSFRFMIGEMTAPFSPDAYREAVEAAVKAGAKIIVIDSASHMHEGDGGLLEMHDAELTRRTRGDDSKRDANNMAAWIEPKKRLGKFVNRMLQIDAHFIFCFRAQEKVKPVKDQYGKTKPTNMGIQPIASERLSYEMTTRLVLPGDRKGVPDLGAQATKLPEPLIPIFRQGAQIDATLGSLLAEWARGDAASARQRQGKSEVPPPNNPPLRNMPEGEQTSNIHKLLASYSALLKGATEKDELAARHEGFEELRDANAPTVERARDVYRLHLLRVANRISPADCQAEVEALLEPEPA